MTNPDTLTGTRDDATETPPMIPTESLKQTFAVKGMTCASCVANVEKALRTIPGVSDVAVNLTMETATIAAGQDVSVKKLKRAVDRAGYKLEPKGSTSLVEQQQQNMSSWRSLLTIQALFGIPLLLYAMLEMFTSVNLLPEMWRIGVQFLLAAIIVYTGRGYYARGFRNLWHRSPNMDSLVALGTGSAFVYSVVTSFNLLFDFNIPGFSKLYFEAAGVILLFITFGKWLEAVAKGKTTESLGKLMDLAPKQALVKREGEWIPIPADEVQISETVLVKAHTQIPVDGIITSGYSHVDEAAITGESIPVEKGAGAEVIGATTNLSGSIEVEARQVGSETVFARIIKLVEEAQGSKAPIQQLADKVAAVFVPTILALALVSGVFWIFAGNGFVFAVNVMISVLIIACPCALGLATPTAVVVGTGRAAAAGILIKSAEALQTLGEVKAIVFDKTGTLTEGRPQLQKVYPDPDKSQAVETLLAAAAAVEARSEHPLAQAIVDFAKNQGLVLPSVENFIALPGEGVAAVVAGEEINIHSTSNLGETDGELHEQAQQWMEQGFVTVVVSRNAKPAMILGLADTIKSDAKEMITALHAAGVKTWMLTGDQEQVARNVASQVGIDIEHVKWGVKPDEKFAQVEAVKAKHGKVAMIGDGVNDAPALVAADVGISFGQGTDVAMNAAQVVLMRNDLHLILKAANLSRATLRKIKQNLFWAFAYNVVGVPIAMGVLYPFTGHLLHPMLAGLAMALSSVSVVSNTLLLKLKRI
ncbi:MAG: heavy metal translocating P-type ATPase [Candidatus Marinimicrobia bacterium]|nr:heavy metal translocating P-type ATPase [Candidatus Neomarinimicrobiota bacterium]MCF7840215.1 heavy metal translocating P-type ATPase [Candidatus Neomarinimicrobiota bacterium]